MLQQTAESENDGNPYKSMTYEVKQWVQVREKLIFLTYILHFCTINFESPISLYDMDLWRFHN